MKTLNFLKNYGIYILTVIIFLLLLNKCKESNDSKIQLIKNKQNIDALNDSLKKEKLKNGDLQYSISGFIANGKELKSLNNELYLKYLNEQGKVISISTALIKLKQDSTELANSLNVLKSKIYEIQKINDSTFKTPWLLTYEYDKNNFDIFKGYSIVGIISKEPLLLKHIDSKIVNRETSIDLTFGEKFEDGKLRIFINSSYPFFKAEQLKGVLIDPNTNKDLQKLITKKHWFTGFSLGVSSTTGINPFTGKFNTIIGPSIHYNVYSW